MAQLAYTAQLREAVAAKVAAGHRPSALADALGLDEATVREWARCRDLRGRGAPRLVGQAVEDARTLWALGATMQEIADELGVREQTLEHYIYRHRDLFPRRRRKGKRK